MFVKMLEVALRNKKDNTSLVKKKLKIERIILAGFSIKKHLHNILYHMDKYNNILIRHAKYYIIEFFGSHFTSLSLLYPTIHKSNMLVLKY